VQCSLGSADKKMLKFTLVITDTQTREKGVGLLCNLTEREVREKATGVS